MNSSLRASPASLGPGRVQALPPGEEVWGTWRVFPDGWRLNLGLQKRIVWSKAAAVSLKFVRTGVFLKTPFYSYLNAVDHLKPRKEDPWVPSLCHFLEHLEHSFHFTLLPSLSLQRTGLLLYVGLEAGLNLSTLIDTVGRITPAVGFSCALFSVQQHPQPLPIGCQQHPSSWWDNHNVS